MCKSLIDDRSGATSKKSSGQNCWQDSMVELIELLVVAFSHSALLPACWGTMMR
jgi:hypothetical protein